MTPTDPFHLTVAHLALAAAGKHGFALAGGQALIAHGVVSRPTEDVDLFTDRAGGVRGAAGPVAAALRAAGFTVDEIDQSIEMVDNVDLDLAEYLIHDGDRAVLLQLAHFDRGHRPVAMAVGPVLHLDDVTATKVAALATRVEARDLIDVAALLDRYTRAELVALARDADPALTDEEFADAMGRLDRLADDVFADLYGLTPQTITGLRERFSDWPRPASPG